MNTLVIFGASGDLAKKKLFAALYNGFVSRRLKELRVIAVGRREWSDGELRRIAFESCGKPSAQWQEFEKTLSYHKMEFSDAKDYRGLAKKLEGKGGVVYFLATPPEFFEVIAKNAAKIRNGGFKRIMVEKPFGESLQTAEKLNAAMQKHFAEEVYRIDHFLGKGMIRNILALRFSNEVFKRVWDKESIESVFINHSETVGAGSRPTYYDAAGAIKDMLQSHLLQMVALVAMKEPLSVDSDDLQKEKVRVISSIKPPAAKDVVVGQYDGYEKEIGKSSSTETFIAAKLSVALPEWKGVPFFVRTGKMLSDNFAEIVVRFKQAKLFAGAPANELVIRIQPDERIRFRFNLVDYADLQLEPFAMEFCESCEFGISTPLAYEKLIADCLQGHRTLFASWPEIEASWRLADKVVAIAKKSVLHKYVPGSGPKEAQKLFQ